MKNWMRNPRVRALMMSSLGFGVTACVAGNPSSLDHRDNIPVSSMRYGPVFQHFGAMPVPYIRVAQNNAVPTLRGMYVNDRPFQGQYYQDYPTQIHIQPHAEMQKSRPVKVQRFNHHLDESTFASSPDNHSPVSNPVSHNGYVYDEDRDNDAYRVSSSSQSPVSAPSQYEDIPQNIVSTASSASLDQSLLNAVQQSPRLAIEDLKIREAEEGLIQAKAQGRFKLNLEGVVGASQSETDFNVVNRTDSDFRIRRAANLDLSLPIYQGGLINARKKVASVGIESAKANYEVVQSAVSQEAVIAHLNVIRDRQLIQLYERNVELLKDQKHNVEAMVNAGENTVTDRALIDARLASIQVALEQSRANLSASESNYKKLVGRPAPSLMPANIAQLPGSLSEIKAVAQKNNPQIKAVQTRAEAAYHNIAVAKSFGRPKLSLQGVLRAAEGQSETIRRNSAAEVLLNINVPLLSGGENKSRVRQAALAQSRAVLENHELHDNLNERLEQLWARVQSARRSKAPNEVQKLAAQKAYEAITKQREAGLATSLDVLSVEQTLLDAEINLIQAQNTEDVSRFQLLALMGML